MGVQQKVDGALNHVLGVALTRVHTSLEEDHLLLVAALSRVTEEPTVIFKW
jgi:hypothetical protein